MQLQSTYTNMTRRRRRAIAGALVAASAMSCAVASSAQAYIEPPRPVYGFPDLVVKDASHDYAVVKNIGVKTSASSSLLMQVGTVSRAFAVPSLAPGTSYRISFAVCGYGDYILQFKADYRRVVMESDETNNTATFRVFC